MNVLRIDGDTYSHRTILSDAGYQWNRIEKCWQKTVSDVVAAKLLARDLKTMEAHRINRKGCRVQLDGKPVWTSKAYVAPQQPSRFAGQFDACDAAGNYCGGPVIPGSAPDDLMW